MSVLIKARKSNQIRALKDANPELDRTQIARQLGIHSREVDTALERQPKRRIKSVAK